MVASAASGSGVQEDQFAAGPEQIAGSISGISGGASGSHN